MRKHLILAVVIAATMPAAMADSFQAMARVLTVAPYMQTISVPQQPVQSCQTVYRTSQQADGYQVTYTYAGRQFTTVLPYDPGQSVQVTVQVHPAP